jgi:uracil-DNA glycosylase family 4
MTFTCPPRDCTLCPRLHDFHVSNRCAYPDSYNGAVPSFGGLDARILVVGLAPGLKGANRTGRPFTGDDAGEILYPALQHARLATGNYAARPDDGFTLQGVRITNAVRCVPPENKPTSQEVNTCNAFLSQEIQAMPNLHAILALGGISHKAIIKACGLRQADYPFVHAKEHRIALPPQRTITLLDSYHTSRYNINTGVLTREMFAEVIARLATFL